MTYGRATPSLWLLVLASKLLRITSRARHCLLPLRSWIDYQTSPERDREARADADDSLANAMPCPTAISLIIICRPVAALL
jgi:hypothetical protein